MSWEERENWKREQDLRQLVKTLHNQVEFLQADNEKLDEQSKSWRRICESLEDKKRVLEAEKERYVNALEEIRAWANAYPLTVFPKPDLKKAHEVLTANGLTLDAISAHAMRQVLSGIKDIVNEALLADQHERTQLLKRLGLENQRMRILLERAVGHWVALNEHDDPRYQERSKELAKDIRAELKPKE